MTAAATVRDSLEVIQGGQTTPDATTDPDELQQPATDDQRFNLLTTLENLAKDISDLYDENKDDVTWVKFYNAPRFLRAGIERIIAGTNYKKEDAINELLEYGLRRLNADDDKQLWIELRQRLLAAEYMDAEDFDLIDGYCERFPFTIDPKSTDTKTLSSRITDSVKKRLHKLKDAMGLDLSTLGLLLLMVGLEGQKGVIHADHMWEKVDEFFCKLRKRVYVVSVLADALSVRLSNEDRKLVREGLKRRILSRVSKQPGTGHLDSHGKECRDETLANLRKVCRK